MPQHVQIQLQGAGGASMVLPWVVGGQSGPNSPAPAPPANVQQQQQSQYTGQHTSNDSAQVDPYVSCASRVCDINRRVHQLLAKLNLERYAAVFAQQQIGTIPVKCFC